MGAGGAVALTGRDVIIIDGNVITALADGEAVKLEFPNPIGQMKVSKDGNAIYAMQYSGQVVTVTIRILRGSYDDQILNSSLQDWIADPAGFSLMAGSFIKRIGDGQGTILSDVYQLAGGIFEKIPSAKSSMEGDPEQSVVEYTMLFRNNLRIIQ
jgi:hypothetical protein